MTSRKFQTSTNENNDDDSNVLFYVNKNGFPIDQSTWERMWSYAGKLYPEGKDRIDQLRNRNDHKDVPIPSVPVFGPQTPIPTCLKSVQSYINALRYNHTGTQLYEIRKYRPLAGLMVKAKEMTKEALPIKCLEAVILALYLTNGLEGVDRFPIGFKSVLEGHKHYHVVLGIRYNGRFGALGISRRHDLMDKPLTFASLHDLLDSYDQAYARYGHQLKKAKVGGLVPHDLHSQEKIMWDGVAVGFSKVTQPERQKKLDRYSREFRSMAHYGMPSPPKRQNSNNKSILMNRRENTIGFLTNPNDKQESREVKSASPSKLDAIKYQVRI